MKDALRVGISGIKCDTPTCDFIDMDVKVEEYPQWLNKPCPKCGANLLTQEDYNTVTVMMDMMKMMNSIFPQVEDSSPDVSMRVTMNGTGDVDFSHISFPHSSDNKPKE